jgi:hypothetical protein
MDAAIGDPDRVERLDGLTPRVMAGIMSAAADALEADGVDVPTAIDAAVERIGNPDGIGWH